MEVTNLHGTTFNTQQYYSSNIRSDDRPGVDNSTNNIMSGSGKSVNGYQIPQINAHFRLPNEMRVPLLYSSILRDTDWSVILFSWVISAAFLLICTLKDGTREKFMFYGFYIALSGLQLYANQKLNIRSFIIQQQLSAVIKQNEEMAREIRANELRHMIGNVAHDLKTPLASFVSGLDLIADIAKEGLSKVNEGSYLNSSSTEGPSIMSNKDLLANALREAEVCMRNVLSIVQDNRNINNFMMMTINRCIDYTKASKGLKLVPKYETIDLKETLLLPFKCMKDISLKVRVELEPLSKNICSHIVTDKQWLQENILCLLSNAVKYSAAGLVRGRVVLTTAQEAEHGTNSFSATRAGANREPVMSSTVDPLSGPSLSTIGISEVISPEDQARKENDELNNFFCCFKRRGQVSPVLHQVSVSVETEKSSGLQVRSSCRSCETLETIDIVPVPIVNASKRISVDGAPQQPVLLFEVEDTGIGMTEEMMSTLFNAFRQAQRLAGGTGLGLFSLARRIEALGGSYGVRKRADGKQGSVFWFTMPYRPDQLYAGLVQDYAAFLDGPSAETVDYHSLQSPAMAVEDYSAHVSRTGSYDLPDDCRGLVVRSSQKRSQRIASIVGDSYPPSPEPVSQSRASPLRILIVDDSATIQKMMGMMLRRHGHKVDQADNGAHGYTLVTHPYALWLQEEEKAIGSTFQRQNVVLEELELANVKTAYDVVLMDLQMPIMDGLEAMKRIRQAENKLIEKCGSLSSNSYGEDSRIDVVQSLQRGLSTISGVSVRQSLRIDRGDCFQHPSLHQTIIGISANSDTDTMEDALRAGADAFISKPFTIEAFYDVINKCSRQRSQMPAQS
eukprot:scaffold875_cov183-Ochromonas_danica.AAC.6